MIPAYAEAYCWECHESREIVKVVGLLKYSQTIKAYIAAVELVCGHARQGKSRIVVSEENLERLQQHLGAKV